VLLPFSFSSASLCNLLELASLLELAPCSSGALLHALLELCSMLAMPTLSWHWLNSPGVYAGHALLELVLAKILYLLLYWVTSPTYTGAVRFSGL
jgi:hypothetical protein